MPARTPLLIACLAACAPLPPKGPFPTPTLDPDPTFHTRIADLRTTLGRAGIGLRMAVYDTHYVMRGGRCELASEGEKLDGAALEAITRAFDRYSTSALVASRITHVALCRQISTDEDVGLGHPAGLADLRANTLVLSVSPFLERTYAVRGTFTVDDIVHHELWHLAEFAHGPERMADDPAWLALNPAGFVYGRADVHAGFATAYATTNAIEDRASTYEQLMARPDELCVRAGTDRVLRAKIAMIAARAREMFGEDVVAPCGVRERRRSDQR